MPEEGNTLSPNPNICASCSSAADGIDQTNPPPGASLKPLHSLPSEARDDGILIKLKEDSVDTSVHVGSTVRPPAPGRSSGPPLAA